MSPYLAISRTRLIGNTNEPKHPKNPQKPIKSRHDESITIHHRTQPIQCQKTLCRTPPTHLPILPISQPINLSFSPTYPGYLPHLPRTRAHPASHPAHSTSHPPPLPPSSSLTFPPSSLPTSHTTQATSWLPGPRCLCVRACLPACEYERRRHTIPYHTVGR